jgi:hypothetical protein
MAETEKTKMTEDEVHGFVSTLVSYARDFIESEYEEEREENWRYYHGYSSVPKQNGRHDITMAKARDIIRMVEPAILRPFAMEPNALRFKGRTPQGAQQAEHMTIATRYWFYSRNDGYRLLADAVRESLVCDSTVMRVWWDGNPSVDTHQLTNLSQMDLSSLQALPEVEIVSVEPGVSMEGQPVYSATVNEIKDNGRLVIEGVPLEKFFIDSGARCIDDARVFGYWEEMTVGDAVARGYDREKLLDSVGEETRDQMEDEARRNVVNSDLDYVSGVEDNLPVVITLAYIRMDPENVGTNQLYECTMVGTEPSELLSYEPISSPPLFLGAAYPLPHSPFGEGLLPSLKDDQDASTSATREMLDNLQLSNRPGMEVVEGMVNLGDLMNTELGRIVRSRAPNMVRELTVPFVAGQTLPVLQYLDQQNERKTGISAASMGFSPDMLQSTTKAAVDAANQAAMGQVEYMARNIAETLLKPMFRYCAELIAKNMDRAFWVALADEMVSIDPTGWDMDVDIEVRVGLGTGRMDERLMALGRVHEIQKEIINSRGIGNGLVNLAQYLNTINDMLALSGVDNSARYIGPATPQVEQRMAQEDAQQKQAAQQQGAPPDPSKAIIASEQIKAQTKMQELQQKGQLEMIKARFEAQFKMIELMKDDDFKRDELIQKLVLEASEIEAKYGTQIDIAQIKAAQDATQPTNGAAQ